MGKESIIGKTVKQYLAGAEGKPSRTCAKELVEANPDLFKSEEQARDAVRYYRGTRGDRHRAAVSEKTYTGQTPDRSESRQWEEGSESACESFTTPNDLVTLEQALALCKADLSVWEVEKWIANRWGNQTQVKVWFRRRENEPWEDIRAEIDKRRSAAVRPAKRAGNGVGVAMLSDFHLGAYVGKLIKTPDFNYSVVCAKLEEIAETINGWKYRDVKLFLLGDFIESFSGLNHINSWKGLQKGAHGFNAIILAHEILSEHLYGKIKNLSYVGFVSGNHDRVTSDSAEDVYGEAAMAMEYIFKKDFKIESEWSPLLLSKEFDGINYVCTHGHLGISRKEVSELLFDYGKQGVYNLFAKGHLHTRKGQRKQVRYENQDYIIADTRDYRAIHLPSLFTGNFYSESMGFSTNAGFMLFANNGNGRPNSFDYSV